MQKKIRHLFLFLLLLTAAQLACSAPINAARSYETPLPVESPAESFLSQETPAVEGFCPAISQPTSSSGLIASVTLARGSQGERKDPVDPTSVFGPTDTIHAIVAVEDAPQGTLFKSAWRAVDIGDPAACDTLITEYELSTDGTRNIDFTLSSESAWPVGAYKVEIYVNGTLDQVLFFTVQ